MSKEKKMKRNVYCVNNEKNGRCAKTEDHMRKGEGDGLDSAF